MTTRFLYQPHDGQTVWCVLALPQRGQVLITEKLPKLINRPSLIARQVDDVDRPTFAVIVELSCRDAKLFAVLNVVARLECIRHEVLELAA